MTETKAQHTPLPWTYEGFTSIFAPSGLAVANTRADHFGADRAQANAAFIVRACNSHYEMVEALETLLADIDDQGYGGVPSTNLPMAQAALAKAKGGAA
jgi:hypothetical protein